MMTGIIFFDLFRICYFSSTNCSEVMSKRTRKDSGEERVTAKLKPMMNLVSRCSEKDPDVLASTTSESTWKTLYESQFTTELVDREASNSSSYSEWNADEKWSSQEWKYSDGSENGETC